NSSPGSPTSPTRGRSPGSVRTSSPATSTCRSPPDSAEHRALNPGDPQMNHRPSGRNPWLPHRPSADAAARVFLIPYSGCGASMYRQWPRSWQGVNFVPVELPGHETRFAEPNFSTYQELAQAMIPGLEEYLDVPFAFFGHCGSALAAYEVSAELARTGRPVASQLYVSSQVAPQDGPAGRFLAMDDTELRAELESLMRRMGGDPNPELLSFYLEILRADVE